MATVSGADRTKTVDTESKSIDNQSKTPKIGLVDPSTKTNLNHDQSILPPIKIGRFELDKESKNAWTNIFKTLCQTKP